MRAALDNGTENTSHTLIHAKSAVEKGRRAFPLRVIISYLEKEMLTQGRSNSFLMDHSRAVVLTHGVAPAVLRWVASNEFLMIKYSSVQKTGYFL